MENGPKPINALVNVSFDRNYSSAFMIMKSPENGGSDITIEAVLSAIKTSGVIYGIQKDVIRDAVKNRSYNRSICIARWKAPVDGENGSIEFFFERNKVAAPVEDEHGIVDYKDLGKITNVYKGTKIARIHMPTEGEPGVDVLGKPVRQRRGLPAVVRIGAGTVLTNNNTEIVACIDGNLRYQAGSFVVEENLVIKGDVDLSTGNIDFIGNVTVKGNVIEGFKVHSKKNVVIEGGVTEAEIYAEGDVTVRLGCVNSIVECKGNVKLNFCRNSTITSQGTVESGSFLGSEIYAGGSILASGKGVMAGGKYTAMQGVEASVIGAESYVKTFIVLGDNAVMSEEREDDETRLNELNDKVEQLTKMIDALDALQKQKKLSERHEKMRSDAIELRQQMQDEVKNLCLRIEEINAALERMQKLEVRCKKQFYPGASIRINDLVYAVNEVYVHSKAAMGAGEIVILPM